MEIVAAFGQQAVDQVGVDAIGREHRLGDALRRVLIVVEPRRAEAEVEIGDDRRHVETGGEAPRRRLWAMVEAPTPPLAPITAMTRPSGLAPGARNRCETAWTKSTTPNGATRYSLTPRAINWR